jgi:hypothetical protein
MSNRLFRDALHALKQSRLHDLSPSVGYYQKLKFLVEIRLMFLRSNFSNIFWTVCEIKNSLMIGSKVNVTIDEIV